MGVVMAAIMPHGLELIPELAGDMLDRFAETRNSMKHIAQLIRDQRIRTIVLATPHGLRLDNAVAVVTSEFTEGILEANSRKVRLRCACAGELAQAVLATARKLSLSVSGVNYGTSEGPTSCMPMDWGTLIPLWFLTKQGKEDMKVVVVSPCREIPMRNLIRFGHAIAEAAKGSKNRVAFVASADQGHAHMASGPYGFHPASAEFDKMVETAVLSNDLAQLFSLPKHFIEDAKPDSLWQLAMLQGILEQEKMVGQLLSYEVPTYFGMLCAAYLPENTEMGE